MTEYHSSRDLILTISFPSCCTEGSRLFALFTEARVSFSFAVGIRQYTAFQLVTRIWSSSQRRLFLLFGELRPFCRTSTPLLRHSLRHLNRWFIAASVPAFYLTPASQGAGIEQVWLPWMSDKPAQDEKRSPLKPHSAGCIFVHCVDDVQEPHKRRMKTCNPEGLHWQTRSKWGEKKMCWETQRSSAWRCGLSSLFLLFATVAQLSFGCETTWKAVVRIIWGHFSEE